MALSPILLQTETTNFGKKIHIYTKQNLPANMGELSKIDKYWTGVNTLGKFSSFTVFSLRKGSVYTILNRKNSEKFFLACSTRE